MAVVVSALFQDGGTATLRQAEPAASARQGTAPAGREAASARLDLKGYKRTLPTRRVVLRTHRCKVRTCRTCGPRHGYRVRGGLLAKADQFRKPGLLTLTCKRANFESPEDAHSFITDGGLIRRLMRFLGVKRYVWVLEFQQKTGMGWPHWHILIDLADLPGQRVDLTHAWRLWRDKWQCGGVDLQLRKHFTTSTHAIRYVTKYLTKYPQKGYPAWVLQSTRRIRFFQACRKLGPILSDPTPAPSEADPPNADTAPADDAPAPGEPVADDEPATPKRRAAMRPLAERMAECDRYCTAVLERRHGDDGPAEMQYLGTLPIRHGRLAYLAHFQQLRSPVQVQSTTVRLADGDMQVVELSLPDTPRLAAGDAFDRLKDEMHALGEFRRTANLIAERARQLIDDNAYTNEPDDEPAALAAVDDDLPF